MEKIILNAEARTKLGSKSPVLRKQGLIPAILYGYKIKNVSLKVEKTEFDKVFDAAGRTTLIDLKIKDSETHKVLIQEIQYDPVSDQIIHIDFHQVKMTEKIKTEVPVIVEGEAPTVKDLEGSLILNKAEIEIECLPQDLIHEIKIDISGLKTFEDKILVKDLVVPKNITILNDAEEVVALVNPPRSEEELAELEEKPEEDVEAVEVEGAKPEEGKEAPEGGEVAEGKGGKAASTETAEVKPAEIPKSEK